MLCTAWRVFILLSYITQSASPCRRVKYRNEIQRKVSTSSEVSLFFPEKGQGLFPVYNEDQGCPCGLISPVRKARPWAGILQGSNVSCAASLLNHLYLISSASCVCRLLRNNCSSTQLSKYMYFEPPPKSLWVRFPFANAPEDSRFFVKGCYIHGLYNKTRGSDDVALLSLEKRIPNFEPGLLQPICLPTQRETTFNDLDCDVLRGKKQRISCGYRINPSNHSFITAFKSTPESSELPCFTNSLGPLKYASCVSKFQDFSPCRQLRSPFSVPQSSKCVEALKSLNVSTPRNASYLFVNIKTLDGTKISCPNKGSNAPAINELLRSEVKYGWCYTCTDHLSQCRDWGYCSKECSHRDRGPGPFLLEKPAYAFTTRDLGICGDNRKQFCVSGQLLQAPSLSFSLADPKEESSEGDTLKEVANEEEDENTERDASFGEPRLLPLGLMEDLEDYISFSKKEMAQMCNEHSGGSIWKKLNISASNEQLELAVLTGIISNPGRECNESITESQKGLPIHTRIHSYLPWILSVTNNGKCKAHKNDLYVEQLSGNNLEANLGLTRQFYCSLKMKGRDEDLELLNPSSEKYSKWKLLFQKKTDPILRLQSVQDIEFFEFQYNPDKSISAAFALLTVNKTNVPTLKRAIMLRELSIQVMMNMVSIGFTPNHLELSWKWSGSELNILLKERSRTPVMRLSVGISLAYGHLSDMGVEPIQIYRAHVNHQMREAQVLSVEKGGVIGGSSYKVEILDLSLSEEKDFGWISTFGFQTNDIQSLGIGRKTKFCFLVGVHQDIRNSSSTGLKFPLTSQHCFMDIE